MRRGRPGLSDPLGGASERAPMGDFVVFIQSVSWPSMHFFSFLGAFALYIVNRHQGSGPFSLACGDRR